MDTINYANSKHLSEDFWNSDKNIHLNVAIKSSYIDTINYRTRGNFRK